MTDIMLTNDDGYQHKGFKSLFSELAKHFSVVGVAPDREMSWVGKSMKAMDDLELKKIDDSLYSLTGTPADCVQIGLYNLLKEKPKLLVSGINQGPNVGSARILSSGTVGAAMEASMDGVKSLAVSLWCPLDMPRPIDYSNSKLFAEAAKIVVKIAKIMMETEPGPHIDLLCVNILYGSTVDTEFEITKPFTEHYGNIKVIKDGKFTQIPPPWHLDNLKDGTDLKALREKKISITPLSLELVEKSSMDKLRKIIEKKW